MREMVASAEQVLFLGFSFQPENMELLTLKEHNRLKQVYATGKGVSAQEVDEVVNRIGRLYTRNGLPRDKRHTVRLEEGATCSDLLLMHWRNLSLA